MFWHIVKQPNLLSQHNDGNKSIFHLYQQEALFHLEVFYYTSPDIES